MHLWVRVYIGAEYRIVKVTLTDDELYKVDNIIDLVYMELPIKNTVHGQPRLLKGSKLMNPKRSIKMYNLKNDAELNMFFVDPTKVRRNSFIKTSTAKIQNLSSDSEETMQLFDTFWDNEDDNVEFAEDDNDAFDMAFEA